MTSQLPSLCAMLFFTLSGSAHLTTLAYGGNKKASVSEEIGVTKITINYDRPAVKGREGKIWNNLVHVGYKDLGFGTSKAAPWRAGANENTKITFSTDVKIERQPLKAGAYTTLSGLASGYSALPLSTGAQKDAVEKMIVTLKEGKDIN